MKCLFVFVVYLCAVSADLGYYARLDKLTPEEPCNRVGGICTFAEDCPQLTEQSGLCPRQQDQGVECCYGNSRRDTRCQTNGGHCIPTDELCRPEYKEASDCPIDQKCCILLNK